MCYCCAMKKIILTALIYSIPISICAAVQSYRADVYDVSFKPDRPDFTFQLTEVQSGSDVKVTGVFKKDNQIMMLEEALVNEATADVIEYKIDQKQTGESGFVQIKGNKIKIKFVGHDQVEKNIEINKPDIFVAPANFDRWLKKNFTIIKEKKSLVFDFLVWDKLDTYKFKIKYIGQVELRGKKMHQFKMNIDNAFIATFLDPINIWYSLDMSEIQQYQGLVAVKLGQRPNLKKMEAVVQYFH